MHAEINVRFEISIDEQIKTPRSDPTNRMVETETLGEAEVQIDVDEETYQRLYDAYCNASEARYSGGFDTFALNYCSIECQVTVDGEPVDPDAEE